MMKKIITTFILFFSLAALFSFVTPAKRNLMDEKATVYIYRLGQMNGAMANWAIFADEVKICKLSNNKYLKLEVAPGKHTFTAKIGGVGLLKKETEIEIDAEPGKSYYVACNVKQSITRARLELLEVTKSSADKQMVKMTLDNCQEKIGGSEEK